MNQKAKLSLIQLGIYCCTFAFCGGLVSLCIIQSWSAFWNPLIEQAQQKLEREKWAGMLPADSVNYGPK